MVAVMKAGRSDKLRHLNRTHRVSLDWLHERFQDPAYNLLWEHSNKHAADICAKAFPDMPKWRSACALINHLLPGEFPEIPEFPLAAKIPVTPHVAVPGGVAPLPRNDDEAGANLELHKQNKTHPDADLPFPNGSNRRLIELCCGESSLLGQKCTSCSKGCGCIRLTQKIDMTSDAGLAFALCQITHAQTLLWCSIPCTGGCPWNRINVQKIPVSYTHLTLPTILRV